MSHKIFPNWFRKTEKPVLCSNCFQGEGLRLDALKFGVIDNSACPNCGSSDGAKLTALDVSDLVHRFFVWGTMLRLDYGGAPVIQVNKAHATDVNMSPWFEKDLRLLEKIGGFRFFYYGPRTWMVGEVEPLKSLEDPSSRGAVIERIITEYPTMEVKQGTSFYRVRRSPKNPDQVDEYDSAPLGTGGTGRLDTATLPILYACHDLELCVHECRFKAEDDLYVGTLGPTRALKMLDLTELLREEGVTEFESLDIAVHMLFLAADHSYPIARDIAAAARTKGFDGLIYPSYFSLLRTGAMPFETVYGISTRKFESQAEYERSKIAPNLAIFGRPVSEGLIAVKSINRLIISRAEYTFHFGPVGY
jgi:hypothetical protein